MDFPPIKTDNGVSFSETGLVIGDTITFDEWEGIGKQLGYMEGAIHWWIGDWLNYGEAKWGEVYGQALDDTGFSYDTLRADKYVSSRFQLLRRRNNLSWSHHRELAPFDEPEQEKWLDRVVQEGMTRGELRANIRQDKYLSASRSAIDDDNRTIPVISFASYKDWLPHQDRCDLLITDPPYMTDVDDIETFARDWLPMALDLVKPTGRAYICIGAYPQEIAAYLTAPAPDHLTLENILVWTYRNTLGPQPKYNYKLNWQAILYFKGEAAPPLDCPIMVEQFTVQDINAPDGRLGDRLHAWQKPDELGRRLIQHSTKANDVVFDPFAGTGTFLIEAAKLGRIAIGCDADSGMIDTALERGCIRG